MGLFKGSMTTRRYRVGGFDPTMDGGHILDRLQHHAFAAPISATRSDETFGWVSALRLTDTEFRAEDLSFGQYRAFALRVDVKQLPAKLFRAMLAETGDYVSLVRAQDRQWWAAGALTLPRAESGGCAGEALAEVLLAAWGPV